MQAHIWFKHKDFLQGELEIIYSDLNSETDSSSDLDSALATTWGRADLCKEDGKTKYLWEVKPVSYRKKEKREIAEKQLERYVTNCENAVTGDKCLDIELKGMAIVPVSQEIFYTVNYWEEANGLVFYTFKRQKIEREPETVTQTVTEEERDKVRVPATSNEFGYDSAGNLIRNGKIIFTVAVMDGLILTVKLLLVEHTAKQSRNPTELSASIIAGCQSFLSTMYAKETVGPRAVFYAMVYFKDMLTLNVNAFGPGTSGEFGSDSGDFDGTLAHHDCTTPSDCKKAGGCDRPGGCHPSGGCKTPDLCKKAGGCGKIGGCNPPGNCSNPGGCGNPNCTNTKCKTSKCMLPGGCGDSHCSNRRCQDSDCSGKDGCGDPHCENPKCKKKFCRRRWDPRCWFGCTCEEPKLPPDPDGGDLEDELDRARKTVSPIIIDLDGSGIDTISINNNVYFDHSGDGFVIKTGWVGPNSGLLVRDINGNGTIDSGRELFGNHTLLENGQEAVNGFEALRDISRNKAIFDNTSPYWNEVKIWIDANSNGRTEEGEVISLEEAGILSINLSYELSDFVDAQGNSHKQIGTAQMADNRSTDVVDVWFVRKASDSYSLINLEESEEVKVLPNIRGFGRVYSLHQAMMRDDSGRIQNLVEEFIIETDEDVRVQITNELLQAWAGTNTKVETLEAFAGIKYDGQHGPNATAILNNAYSKFARSIYANLMAQTHLKYLYNLAEPVSVGEKYVYDLTNVAKQLLEFVSEDSEMGEEILLTFAQNIHEITALELVDIDSLRDELVRENVRLGYFVDVLGKNIVKNSNRSTLNNKGALETLKGVNASTVFLIEAGHNRIISGSGNDMFFFNRKLGFNTIVNGGGDNAIILDKSITPENVRVNQVFFDGNMKDFNVEITVDGLSEEESKIIIEKFNYGTSYDFVFANGSKKNILEFFSPTEIYCIEDLEEIRNNLLGNYSLMNDIDMEGTSWTPIGTGTAPFAGVFNGNGYTIQNLNVNRGSLNENGLFGVNKGIIDGVKLSNVSIIGKSYIGSIVGINDSGTVRNCEASINTLTGYTVIGGLVGYNKGRVINASVTIGTNQLKGTSGTAGGLVGENTGTITNGSVDTGTGGIGGNGGIGGFVGNNSGTITKSSVTGIKGVISTVNHCGGFAGRNSSGSIETSYTTLSVQGTTHVGGFVGGTYDGRIDQCYSIGNVTAGKNGTHVGGFIGDLSGANTVVSNSFSLGTAVNTSASTGGFAGNVIGTIENCYTVSEHDNGFYGSGAGSVRQSFFNSDISKSSKEEGRTTEELMDVGTYNGWDFETIWIMATEGYPILRALMQAENIFEDNFIMEIQTEEIMEESEKESEKKPKGLLEELEGVSMTD